MYNNHCTYCTPPCVIIIGYMTNYNGIYHRSVSAKMPLNQFHEIRFVIIWWPECFHLFETLFLAQLNYTQLVPPRCVSFSQSLSLKDILNTCQKHNHICRINGTGLLNKGKLKLRQDLGSWRPVTETFRRFAMTSMTNEAFTLYL